MLKEIKLTLGKNDEEILNISRALSSPNRLEILKLLNTSSLSVKELSEHLNLPISTTSVNISILEASGLILTQERITKSGKSKLCSRNCDGVALDIFKADANVKSSMLFKIPIGNYTNYNIIPECGIATNTNSIGLDNDDSVFYSPDRFKAGLIWFKAGFLEYRVSTRSLPAKIKRLNLSFEACSEAPFYRNDWKSDISIWINNIEIGYWQSPGDFGGRAGSQNPKWWPEDLTQYGILVNLEINSQGSYINKEYLSSVKLSNLNIKDNSYISIKIGVKEDAKYCGGINLFGSSFGDYPQDIILEVEW